MSKERLRLMPTQDREGDGLDGVRIYVLRDGDGNKPPISCLTIRPMALGEAVGIVTVYFRKAGYPTITQFLGEESALPK